MSSLSNNPMISSSEIRDIFKVEKHALHINDTHEETIEIGNLVFNENSILNLNSSRIKEFKKFNLLFKQYVEWLEGSIFKKDNFNYLRDFINYKFNEKKNLSKIIQILKSDCVVSLISDAGTPSVSDPGAILVNECLINKIDIGINEITPKNSIHLVVSVDSRNPERTIILTHI